MKTGGDTNRIVYIFFHRPTTYPRPRERCCCCCCCCGSRRRQPRPKHAAEAAQIRENEDMPATCCRLVRCWKLHFARDDIHHNHNACFALTLTTLTHAAISPHLGVILACIPAGLGIAVVELYFWRRFQRRGLSGVGNPARAPFFSLRAAPMGGRRVGFDGLDTGNTSYQSRMLGPAFLASARVAIGWAWERGLGRYLTQHDEFTVMSCEEYTVRATSVQSCYCM